MAGIDPLHFALAIALKRLGKPLTITLDDIADAGPGACRYSIRVVRLEADRAEVYELIDAQAPVDVTIRSVDDLPGETSLDRTLALPWGEAK